MILVSPSGMTNTILDKLSDCARNNDNLQRLACYDKLAQKTENSRPDHHEAQATVKVATTGPLKLENTTTLPVQKIQPETILTAPESAKETQLVQKPLVQTPLVQTPQPARTVAENLNQQQAIFGQENKEREKNLIKQIQAKVIKVKKGPYKNQIITLDNGQIWRETDGSGLKLAKGQQVTIVRGTLGSFFIGKENTNRRIRAKRVK
jgi:hypothetical protein